MDGLSSRDGVGTSVSYSFHFDRFDGLARLGIGERFEGILAISMNSGISPRWKLLMAVVVVDANVLIAARLSRDQNHECGRAIAEAIDQGDLPTAYVLSDVLEEIIDYIQARAGHDVATETLDAVIESSGFELKYTTKSDFDAGRSLFRRYESLSLTDAVIVATMQREEIEYLYSFEDGFDSVSGVSRLTTPDDTFKQ